MQPRLELEKVQMSPTATYAVVDQLMLGPAVRTGRPLARVLHLEVDAPLSRVQFHLGNVPRWLQAECGREQRFDLVTHHVWVREHKSGIEPPIVMFVDLSISTENGIEPSGPGFKSEQLDKLNQGRRIVSSKNQGHGIGLLTVLLLINQLNGEAKFDMRDGGGTIVSLWVPSTPPDDDDSD